MLVNAKGISLVDQIYPVGSIYMSTVNKNPETYFGGTWVSWGSGRVPVGVNSNDTDFNTPEKTGGEKTHKLTIDEMPSHNHTFQNKKWSMQQLNGDWGAHLITGKDPDLIENTGGDKSHNNLQPYITCYMWKRTA